MLEKEQISVILVSERATMEFAQILFDVLEPGNVVALTGDLGAGKSFLARALLRVAADNPDLEVPSPTFSLVQNYDLHGQTYLHADLYRLSDASEADELGLFDDPDAILLVEWPERLPELAARTTYTISLHLISEMLEGRTLHVGGAPHRLEKLAPMLESGSDSGIKLI
ncbi:tRNA (adenosine(37)-N6)-threonylcarbamoyltransferase complex ATPase subunit type 1 TsaE [Maritalea mediterranea]|uniref:tRNA threonylcarbamoyladenosine biosynthesis protein TsaE n=1 Tax=Maritalea mediterranea TaxID=2909667 RepID=A0ABS9E5L1_9HYPH|nr:tRNA (adenosine(37)-N6)-threonylcarbamoyltransferase complex ATPase subunit type 1 TsaE [Maritalea mediterranea]MCF4097199.1 tRNA (adenosine(37)-N6)-threonylcarbamoyltransferase complex ATPase subunit type 1 TsaE [Maritalea mediterranea]